MFNFWPFNIRRKRREMEELEGLKARQYEFLEQAYSNRQAWAQTYAPVYSTVQELAYTTVPPYGKRPEVFGQREKQEVHREIGDD